MKKIILLLIFLYSTFSISQTSSGMEQEFDYGIKNNSSQQILTPDTLVTKGVDGTYGHTSAYRLPVSTATKDSINTKIASNAGLQNAYNFEPEIVTSAIKGAVTIRRGSAADTDTVLAVQNGAGTDTFAVTGNGNITGGTYNGYVPANDSGLLHKNSTPETKIGSLTLGENITHASDNWIALGTSVTDQDFYTVPLAKQLSLILNNFGVSGSVSGDLPARYADIPTLNSGNIDQYRLLSLEYGINDAFAAVPINTYKTNLTNAILNAKGKGWANNKILIINSNYCTHPSLDTELEPYAIAAIEVAIAQGVQYVDIYNYTKNNGGGSLLSDGIHPTSAGGIVYARGVAVLMNGGVELQNLNVFHSLQANLLKINKDSEVFGITLGRGNNSVATNTAYGYQTLLNNTSGSANSGFSYQTLLNNTTGSNNTAAGYLSMTSNTTGSDNSSLGFASLLSNTTGSNNTAIGNSSLRLNTTGLNNTALGFSSLYSNTTGGNNTAIGNNSLLSNTTGSNNTSLGGSSLRVNTTGIANSSFGVEALFKNVNGIGNSALGIYSMYNNTSGSYNSTIGLGSLFDNTTGSNNTAVGRDTGRGITTGSGNTIIGANVTGLSSSLENNIILSNGTGAIKAQHDGSNWTFTGGIASPTFTGVPIAPTAVAGTNTTQVATTAFVQGVARPYKVYTALLSQTGTNAPVETVLENTLGGTVVWSRTVAGSYFATLTGAFTTDKTTVLITNGSTNGNYIHGAAVSTTNVNIIAPNDGQIDRATVEIRVYN